MMQIIDTLLGCSASSRHVGSAHRVDGAMGSRTEEVQLEPGSACGGALLLTRRMYRFGLEGMGVGNAPDFSCWCPGASWCGSPVMGAWFQGLKMHSFPTYSVAPECKPRGHDFTCSSAGAQGGGGGSFSDKCPCWYISRVIMLMPN